MPNLTDWFTAPAPQIPQVTDHVQWGQDVLAAEQQIAQLQQQEYQEYFNMASTKVKKSPSPSQMIDTHQIPTKLLESSLASIDRELEERASALSEIARLLEVVEETDSTIRYHISNLRMGAIQIGKMKSSSLPSYLGQFEQEIAGEWPIPVQAGQIAGAAVPQVGQQAWPQGQG